MRAFPYLLAGVFLALLVSLPASAQTTDLIAGQNTVIGIFTASTVGNTGIFRYEITEPGWCIGITHLYVAATPPAKAAPGRFQYHGDAECGDSFEFQVDLGSLAGSGYFYAGHAEVKRTGGGKGGRETAWALGPFDMPRGWGWYLVTVRE